MSLPKRSRLRGQTTPIAVPPHSGAAVSLLRRFLDHSAFILPRDLSLFLVGARTDAAIARTRAAYGARAAFETAYTCSPDPWASATPRYRYQERKYEQLMALLPRRRFGQTLDLGCGLGLLSRHLAARSDHVLGINIASSVVDYAARRSTGIANLTFEQGDVSDLRSNLDGQFDLVVIADTIYYLSPLDDELLTLLSTRVASLLAPGGICLLANHYFFSADQNSRLSRRISDAFAECPAFSVLGQHRRAFFLATLLGKRPQS